MPAKILLLSGTQEIAFWRHSVLITLQVVTICFRYPVFPIYKNNLTLPLRYTVKCVLSFISFQFPKKFITNAWIYPYLLLSIPTLYFHKGGLAVP